MGIFNYFSRKQEQRANPVENPAIPLAASLNSMFGWLLGSNPTAAGELVNEVTALQHITVYSCVRILSESVGTLTLRTYKRLNNGRQESLTDPVYKLLALTPNDEMSASTLWEQMTGCLALTGNSYTEILRSKDGTPQQLYPLHPLKTEPVRLPIGKLAYRTIDYATGGQRIIDAMNVLHVRLFSWDGLKGLSPIQQSRQDIGLAEAATKYGARFFGNGSKPGGILTPVGKIDEQDLVNMRTAWEHSNGGANQGRTAVLPTEWKYTQLGISPEDSQFLQTRQMSRADIAALFRVPPHMVGDLTRLSNNNHENESLSFVIDTLRPYLIRIEQEIQIKLLGGDPTRFVEFDVSERLRGDFQSTMQGFAIGKQWGFYNSNMVLEKLGENPIGPVGDVFWAPVNMTNAANLLQPPDATEATPTPAMRNLFEHYTRSFSTLFADGVGRISARKVRDTDALTQVFTPVLTSVQELIESEARAQFHLADDWHAGDKAQRDFLKSAASRAIEWDAQDKLTVTATELGNAIRSIYFYVYREAGAALAEKGMSHA